MKYAAPPERWNAKLLIALLPKNGEPYSESYELALDGPIDHWGQLYVPAAPIRADVTANLAGERILVKVTVNAGFTLPCSRCLAETGVAILGDLRYLFTLRPDKDARGDTVDDSEVEDDGDVDVIPLDGYQTEIDLASCVWEVLLLNLPERVLCREDCLGLCKVCGANRNESDCGCKEDDTDPRFAVLRDLT